MESKNALVPTTEEMTIYQLMAETAGKSRLYDKIGGKEGLLSIMLMARELGIPPMQALTSMSVIQGKVEVSPRLMNMMIRKAGHKLKIEESTNAICRITGTRSDTKEEYTASFSIEEARTAGLVRSGGGWEKYSSDMLFARCLSRLARRLFADVISSAYVEGEISDDGGTKSADLRTESLDKPEQPHGKNVQIEEAEVVKVPQMTVEEFVAKLKEKTGDKYTYASMNVYLDHLAESKKVGIQSIMDHALHDSLMDRFCRGWAKWYSEMSESTDDAVSR